MIAVDWDAETGARGRQRARWSRFNYTGKSALSPDGRTLAQVQKSLGLLEISLLDLESGNRRRVAVPGTFLNFPRWQPDGTLLAMGALSDGEHGIVRVRDGEKIEMVAVVASRDKPLTWANEFEVTPDGKTAVILTTDGPKTYWWARRSGD